jgi:hypothetical protein
MWSFYHRDCQGDSSIKLTLHLLTIFQKYGVSISKIGRAIVSLHLHYIYYIYWQIFKNVEFLSAGPHSFNFLTVLFYCFVTAMLRTVL